MKISVWILLLVFALSTTASANPTFSNVEAGDIRIDEQGPVYNIYSTDRSIGAFQSFGNLAGETINSIQPSADNSAIFKVTGGQPSEFFGSLNANSHIFLVNPNGILFGAGSQVNAPGLVASALDLKSADFDAREFTFEKGLTGSGYVLNEGMLSSPEGGYVALLGTTVENRGTISTPGGSTLLAASGAATVGLDADGGISVTVTKPIEGAKLIHSGLISAAGGLVYLSASAMDAVFDQVLNLTGVVEANTVEERGGKIILDGGDSGVVAVTGTLNARGDGAGENGGDIRVLGDKVALLDTAKLDASGFSGGFIELSGDELVQRGTLDVSPKGGEAGTLFYDPLVINIVGGTSDGSDSDVSATVLNNGTLGTVLFADTPSPFNIFESELEATNANIILEARQSISTSGVFGSDILIQPNRDLTLRTANDTVAGAGSIDLFGGTNSIIHMQGTGSLIIAASTTGANAGNVVLGRVITGGGDVDVSTSSGFITLRNDITTNGGDVDISSDTANPVNIAPSAGSLLTINTSAIGGGGDVSLYHGITPGAVGTDLLINTSGLSGADLGGDVSLSDFRANGAFFLNDLTINAAGFGGGANGDIDITGNIRLGDNGVDVANVSLTGGDINMSAPTGIFTPQGSITITSDGTAHLAFLNADADGDTVRGTVSVTATDVANTGFGIIDANGNGPNIMGSTVTLSTPRSAGLSTDPLEIDATALSTTGVAGGKFIVGFFVAPPPPPGTQAGVVITGNHITGGDNFQQFLAASTTVTDPGTTTDSQKQEEKEKEGDQPAYVTPGAALPPPPLVAPPPTFQQEAPVDAGTFAPCPA